MHCYACIPCSGCTRTLASGVIWEYSNAYPTGYTFEQPVCAHLHCTHLNQACKYITSGTQTYYQHELCVRKVRMQRLRVFGRSQLHICTAAGRFAL
jgi:hypothetical protein